MSDKERMEITPADVGSIKSLGIIMPLDDSPDDLAYLLELPEGDHLLGRLENERLMPPRLRVMKDTSQLVKQGFCRAGEIYSDAHEGTIGEVTIVPGKPPRAEWTQGIPFIPLRFSYEWLWFEDDGGPLLYRTDNPNDERVRELGDQEFKQRHTHIAMVVDGTPMVLSTAGHDNSASNQLYRACRKKRFINGRFVTIPIPAQRWELTTTFNPKNEHFSPSFRFLGILSSTEYAQAKTLVAEVDMRRLDAEAPEPSASNASEEGEAFTTQERKDLPF